MRKLSSRRYKPVLKNLLLAAVLYVMVDYFSFAVGQTYNVVNSLDSGNGSFRNALFEANGATGSTIQFTADLGYFTVLSPLPTATGSFTINGVVGNVIEGSGTAVP